MRCRESQSNSSAPFWRCPRKFLRSSVVLTPITHAVSDALWSVPISIVTEEPYTFSFLKTTNTVSKKLKLLSNWLQQLLVVEQDLHDAIIDDEIRTDAGLHSVRLLFVVQKHDTYKPTKNLFMSLNHRVRFLSDWSLNLDMGWIYDQFEYGWGRLV